MAMLAVCCSAFRCCLRGLLGTTLAFLLLTIRHDCLASTEEYTLPGDHCHKYMRNKEAVALKGVGSTTYTPQKVCDITLSSANNARWMVHVQSSFILDCRVKFTVFDTNIATSSVKPVVEMSCATPNPGVLRLNTTVVTVRLHHRNFSDYNFIIILTTRHVHPEHDCPWFLCETGDCIPRSLVCDGTNNCVDNSDESQNGTAQCGDYWPFKGENWGVLASVLGAAVVLGLGAACCRHLRKRRDSFDDLYDLNDGPYVHKYAYQYRVIRQHTNASANHHHNNVHSHSHNHRHDNSDRDKPLHGKLLT